MGRLLRLQPDRPDRAIHGYIYYRWTTPYMRLVRFGLDRGGIAPMLRDFAAHRLERTHHAKVVPAEQARRIIKLDTPVELHDLERAVPYPEARDIVIENPGRIALARCACRNSSDAYDGSCGALDSCIYIGDPIASFVVEKQQGARFITPDEALEVLDRAAGAGNIHTLWFKDAAAGRMYALCNCCSCCCVGLKAQRAGFGPLAASGVIAEVDPHACVSCGTCAHACVFDAVDFADGDTAKVDPARCLGCGVCAEQCPSGAIALVNAPDGPEKLPIG